MIPVLRKIAQLNIKYKKNGGLIIDVCTWAPPDKVTALKVGILPRDHTIRNGRI